MKKRFLTVMMTALFLTAFTSQVSAKNFNKSDFNGNYAFTLNGNFFQISNPLVPTEGVVSELGVYKPDGMGNVDFSPVKTTVIGEFVPGIPGQVLIDGFLKGTYTVDTDGTLEMALTLFAEDKVTVLNPLSKCRGVLGGDGSKTAVGMYLIPVIEGNTINVFGSALKQVD